MTLSESLCAETVSIRGHAGDEIEAYPARPTDAARVAVELTAASARDLVAAIQAALESAPAELAS